MASLLNFVNSDSSSIKCQLVEHVASSIKYMKCFLSEETEAVPAATRSNVSVSRANINS